MEAKTTTTNAAAKKQTEQTSRTVTFDYLNKTESAQTE
jgi:hypothetical protein